MGPDDAEHDDDRNEPSDEPERHPPIDLDAVGGWFFLCLLTTLIFRCNGVSLW